MKWETTFVYREQGPLISSVVTLVDFYIKWLNINAHYKFSACHMHMYFLYLFFALLTYYQVSLNMYFRETKGYLDDPPPIFIFQN